MPPPAYPVMSERFAQIDASSTPTGSVMTDIRRLLLATVSLIVAAAPVAKAVDVSRANTWEISAQGGYLKSSEIDYLGKMTFAGGGVDFGYHVNDMVTMDCTLLGGSTSLKNSYYGSSVSFNTVIVTVGADWKLIPRGQFTPIAGVNLGSIRYSNSDRDIGESDFIWGGHVGVRYDVDRNFFYKAVIEVDSTKLKGLSSFRYAGLMVNLGYRF